MELCYEVFTLCLLILFSGIVHSVPVDQFRDDYSYDEIDESYFAQYMNTECQPGELQCESISGNGLLKCLTPCKFCDGNVDCLNASDEINCTCKTRLAGHYVCDGEIHCEDFSDELGCGDCLDNELLCGSPKNKTCLSISAFCQGSTCQNYQRDLICRRLSMRKVDSSVTTKFRSKGYLQSYVDNKWLPICASLGLLASPIVNGHCAEITGTIGNHSYKLHSLSEDYNGLWAAIDNSTTVYSDLPLVFESVVKSCKDKMVYYVECAPPACQQNTPYHSDNLDTDIFSRVIGGENAHYESWRHLVAVFKDGVYQCGGSILNDRWILSASHCYMKITGSRFEIVAGSTYRRMYFPGSQREFVSHIIRHDKFDSYTITNDIALLRLKTPLQLNRWVKPTCLHLPITASLGMLCSVAGWGFREENGTLAAILQEVNIPILDVDKCIKAFTYVDTDRVVCAGHELGGKDSCQGDSGGPLMCYDCEEGANPSECLQNEWIQAGIVSYGRGCARPGVPGVYTRVKPYLDWILDKIKAVEENPNNLPTTVPLTTCDNFSCLGKYGLCLNTTYVCNEKIECFDASDEVGCLGEKSRNPAIPGDPIDQEYDWISSNATLTCTEDQYKCSEVPQCIPYKLQCDEKRQCRDGTDELGCHCVDRLYIKHSDWICDGVNDCFDLGDEFCQTCNFGEWTCLRSRTCISLGKRCDGNVDCKYGEDELNCVAVVPSFAKSIQLDKEGDPLVYQEGRLAIYSEDKLWVPVCSAEISYDVAEQICSYLGFSQPTNISYTLGDVRPFELTKENVRDKRFVKGLAEKSKFHKYLEEYERAAISYIGREKGLTEIESDHGSNTSLTIIPYHRHSKSRSKRETCSMVNIKCGERRCGIIPELQFTDDPPLGGLANLPWAVYVAINGEYLCGGTLIGDKWVVTSLQCLGKISLSSTNVYVVAGSHRDTGSTRILSSREVAFRVDLILPIDSTDFVLLRLEETVAEYSYLSWLCLNASMIEENIWKECVFAGRYKDKFAYQLLVLPNNTAECKNDSFCTNFHSTDDICLNRWSGMLSCRIAREIDSIWYVASIWHYDDNGQCSQPTEHFKLHSHIVNKIYELMTTDYPSAPKLPCEGHHCSLGVCAPQSAVCDSILDCADLTDEWTQCTIPVKLCTQNQDGKCVCQPGYFACSDHVCIEDYKVCDGVADCNRNEDEINCECSMKVEDPLDVKLCDGKIDCFDQTDELDCGCTLQYRCYKTGLLNSGNNKSACLSVEKVCNNVDDCSQGEDEDHCVTLTPTIFAEEDALGRPATNQEGYLLVRYVGEWFTVLLEDWNAVHSDLVCQKLHYKGSLETIGKPLNTSIITQFSRNVPPITVDYRVQEHIVATANIVTYIVCEK